MRRTLAAALAAALAVPAPAQVLRGTIARPSLSPSSAAVPAALAAPSLAAPALAVPSALPAAALPVLTAPLAAAAPAADPAAALAEARALGGALSAAAVPGRDAAPALSGAFDGAAAKAPAEVPGAAPALTPEQFAARAEALFTAGRLPEGRRAAIAWRDAVRPQGVQPTDEEMRERMARSPLTNPEREAAVVELFKLAGATDADIKFQDVGRGRRNIFVVKPGKTDRVIVVGAHHDKVHEGAGTIDNWTGATSVINLYQALRGEQTEATIVFIAFAREEEGLIGSDRYVGSLSREQVSKIDAMINLDTLGVNGVFTMPNISSRSMLERLDRVSRESGVALRAESLWGDSDSTSFRRAGVPAVTLHGATNDVIFDIIHSENDTMAAFSLPHYKNAFLLTLAAIKSLDREPLGADGRRRR